MGYNSVADITGLSSYV